MNLTLASNVRAFPHTESPQDDSCANRSGRGPSEPSGPRGAGRGSARPLTNSKHEHFAHLVTRGESPANAYFLCGYSKNGALQSGNRLLRKPDVRARVEELKAAVSARQVEKIAVDRAWVISMLVENVNRAMQVEPVRDREGNPTGQYTYQGGVANKALELLGKEFGMFQPAQKTEGQPDLVARLMAARKRRAMMRRSDTVTPDSTNLQNPERESSRTAEG